ncbi:MAG: radical SAM protein [Clostridiales bacterium]|nr:radical SAM protein [Clostridiales bacterium]
MTDSGCNVCPRGCGANRAAGEKGFCSAGLLPVVARAAAHYWEEPCISGERGSGAVFFSGCALKCVYCQNYQISYQIIGTELTPSRLREVIDRLVDTGVHNINLVNPTHYRDAILEALEKPLPVPVVYNCGGYESIETLRMFDGIIDIYLPDYKYSDDSLAERFSCAPDYSERAGEAIFEMYRQTGPYKFDRDGLMRSGLIVRHLMLPGHVENTVGAIRWFARNFVKGEAKFSLMRQYIPCGNADRYPELTRRLTESEYAAAEQSLLDFGIEDGYVQDVESASDAYVPQFDCTGVF